MGYKLIFHAYMFNNFMENIAWKTHIACLQHYINIFDEVLFIFAEDKDFTQKVDEYQLIDTLIKNYNKKITFKWAKNTPFREASTFYQEVVENMYKEENCVFFMHSKGVTNVKDDKCNEESIINWIIGMYFYSLNFPKDIEGLMFANEKYALGSILLVSDECRNKNHFANIGGNLWLNVPFFYQKIKNENINISSLTNRWYVENFLGNYLKLGNIITHDAVYFSAFNPYINFDYDAPLDILGEKKEYIEFAKKIKKEIGYRNE